MEITVVAAPLAEIKADGLVVGIFEGEPLEGDAAEANQLLGDAIAEVTGAGPDAELTGKRGDASIFYCGDKLAAKRVVAVGLGKRADLSPTIVQEASGAVARLLRDRRLRTVASTLHRAGLGKRPSRADAAGYAGAATEGTIVGLWEPDAYKADKDRKRSLDGLRLVEADPKREDAVREGLERGRILGDSVNLARMLVNEPANELTPLDIAQRAREMAAEVGLQCEVLDEDAMYRLGMGAILAVSVGSENRAHLVILRHMPNPGEPALALVGKGITFDTGGISIKPAEGMERMKGDMGGAAAVIGAMRAVALLKLPVNVIGLAPCAENMPSGKAFRPGDVVRCMNGKTVEIITTDAEGRMILADALTYATRNLGAKRVVDVATLTGACIISLGHVASGAMGNNPELMDALKGAAASAGEKIWQMPLYDEYRQQLKSDIADMKNTGGRPGGALTAGVFLKEFVDDTPWVHIDIAGTSSGESAAHMAKGPTGVMVRTFVQLAQNLRDNPS
jgi:leucyl aminopeptidase